LSKEHNNPELIARWGEHPSTLETQVNCKPGGVKIGDSNMFEEGGEVFGPVRWPYNSRTEPNYSDPPVKFSIPKRIQAIGTSWWDWRNKRSIGVGFDFDSLLDHNEDVGISPEEIEKLDNIDVPWLEVIRSTRGNGRHVYVWFKEPYPIANNHVEHSAVARSLIPLIAEHTGLNIDTNVDCKGLIMWIWHVNMTKENRGYELVKPATQHLTADHIPPNWRDHIEVTSGGRSKVRVKGWDANGEETKGDELDEMTQAVAEIPLDETHLKILEELEGTGHTALWVHDHHLWQGHAAGLKYVYDMMEEKGTPLRGLFNTNSGDTDPGKPNVFMRPKPNGAFDVYRFGEGTTEDPLWDSHGKWTHIAYNSPATLKQICLSSNGYEGTDEKQGYLFDEVEDLQAALKLLKAENTNLPDNIEGRTLSLHTKGKQTVLTIEKKRKDEKKDFPRYVKTAKGWEILLTDAIETPDEDIENEMMWSELDDQFRALQVKAGRSYKFDSWALKNDESDWVEHPRENIKSYLSQTCPKVDPILGSAIFKAWTLVKHPFQPEYPGGRLWNRDGAQFRYEPIELNEGEHPVHPTWNRVMEHCGRDLNEYIDDLPWCQDWNIRTGGDYLTAWIACMFQNPYGKLPYLFMYGPQNCGKSSFHEALEFLLTRGVAKADRALTSVGGFNSELEEAILAVIDEVDVARAGSAAYNKIKEWVTGTSISIHPKGGVVRDVLSTLHFVQVSNERSSLPVFPGDTRITAMSVSGLEEEIPRERLYVLLKEEGPHFMRTLMDYNVPEATGRLMLPIIETRGKLEAADNNIDSLTAFIEENCYEIPGVAIRLTEFQTRFFATLEPHVVEEWQKGRTLQSKLSEHYLLGRCPNLNQTIIGNFTFNKSTKPSARYIRSGKQLRKEGNDV